MKKCESISNEKSIGKPEQSDRSEQWQQKASLWAGIGLITAGSTIILSSIFVSLILYSG
jgi:CHASE3 domain sensor protein